MGESIQYRLGGGPVPVSPAPRIDDAARHYGGQDFRAAARCCLDIIAVAPRHFDALHLLGVVCTKLGKRADAVAFLVRAEREGGNNAQLLHNLGNAYLDLKLHVPAIEAYQRALAIAPSPDVLNNLGNALLGLERNDDAIARFRDVLTLHPAHAPALYNLGRGLVAADRLEEAVTAFRAALVAAPPDTPGDKLAAIGSALGHALLELGRHAEAVATCRMMLERWPENRSLEWNESLALLLIGHYAEGWRQYESRWFVPEHEPPREGACVLDLSQVAGRHVLIAGEQGNGDILQFVRYAPLLIARGAKVSLWVYRNLIPLLSAMPGLEAVVGPDDDKPAHDLLTPMLSLPLAFGTELSSVPANVPYLRVPPDLTAAWKQRLGPTTRPRIGIAWRGAQHIPQRSVQLPLLAPILAQSRFEFHTLQTDVPDTDKAWLRRHPAVFDHDAEVGDFAETAALISLMDLVITIDTSFAHLAGGLGVPVWIMLTSNADWRWLTGRDDSPWYPTARLFRQQRRNDWASVIQRVAEALAAFDPAAAG